MWIIQTGKDKRNQLVKQYGSVRSNGTLPTIRNTGIRKAVINTIFLEAVELLDSTYGTADDIKMTFSDIQDLALVIAVRESIDTDLVEYLFNQFRVIYSDLFTNDINTQFKIMDVWGDLATLNREQEQPRLTAYMDKPIGYDLTRKKLVEG